MALKGSVTHVTYDEVYGWARFSDASYRPALVQAVVAGQVVAETRADLLYEPFSYLGSAVARCAFMVDVHGCGLGPNDQLHLLAGGEPIPNGVVRLPVRPTEQEILVEQGGVGHVFADRIGTYRVTSEQPLRTVWVYTRSRQLGSDLRRLGGTVGRVMVNDVALDMAAADTFGKGFHGPEGEAGSVIRWTDGKAGFHFATDEPAYSLSFEIYTLAASIAQAN